MASPNQRMGGRAGLLGLAWLLLCLGLSALHLTFEQERTRAQRALEQRILATEGIARLELQQRWTERLAADHEHLNQVIDPLAAHANLYLRRDGVQLLPRVHRAPVQATEPNPQMYLERYRAIFERAFKSSQDPATELDDNETFIAALARALAEGDEARIEQIVRAYLGHRHRLVEHPKSSLAASIVVLEALSAHAPADPRLLTGWLHSGLHTAEGAPYPSLQARLLAAKDDLSRARLARLGEAIAALSRAAKIPHLAFTARLAELPGVQLSVPDTLTEINLLNVRDQQWLLTPQGSPANIQGRRLDLRYELARVGEILATKGILNQGEKLQIALPPPGQASPVSSLEVSVESPLSAARRAQIERESTLKTGILALCALLGLGMGAFATLAEVRKRRFFQLKSDFVATVSHELKTPLSSVRLLAETLERRLKDDERARDYPRRIVNDVDHMTTLVENILSYARLERGKLKVRREPTDLCELLDSIEAETDAWAQSADQRARAQAQGCADEAVVVHRDLEVETATLDPELVRLCLINLMRNACQHGTQVPVRLDIHTRRVRRRSWPLGAARPFTLVTVRDNGPGIAVGDRAAIFEAFESSSTNPSHRGSGLGLAICAAIMTAHQGTIELDEHPGTGTSFTLHFPETAGA